MDAMPHPWLNLTWYLAVQRGEVVGVSADRPTLARGYPRAVVLSLATARSKFDRTVRAGCHPMLGHLRAVGVLASTEKGNNR